MTVPDRIRDALRGCGLPEPYRLLHAVSGGCINQAYAVGTGAGPAFLKLNAAAPTGFFEAERTGLEALADARSGLIVPRVLGLRDAKDGVPALALEWLEPAAATTATWESLGRGLAELHRTTAPRHGFGTGTYLGATVQPNDWNGDWGVFFAEHRIRYLLRLLDRSGSLTPSSQPVYDALREKLPSLLAHAPAASLLHGDLWNGNVLATKRGPALIDPAAYHGDRETDLAMMRLFGGFPERVFDAYHEAWPLEDGWEERAPLYRLHHLLNHQLLFGGSYGAEALAIARRYA